jgi:Flp pilus assembly protein TadD
MMSMVETSAAPCPDDVIAGLLETVTNDEPAGISQLERLLTRYPDDPRLHFLRGSLLAAAQDYTAAHRAMRRAVDLAPDYGIARFQLGFLLLTSGEPHAAQEAWGPLHGLAASDYLRLFAEGLTHLIHDRFAEAIARLEDGISRNQDNPAMNNDMRMIIDEARRKLAVDGDTDALSSSAHLLLQQAALKATRH